MAVDIGSLLEEKSKKKKKQHEERRKQNEEISSQSKFITNEKNEIEHIGADSSRTSYDADFVWDKSYEETAKQNASKRTQSGVDIGTRINNYISDSESLSTKTKEYYDSGYNGKSNSNYIRKLYSDLYAEANELKTEVESNKDDFISKYGEDYYNSVVKLLKADIKSLKSNNKSIGSYNDYLNSFETEEDYDNSVNNQKMVEQYGTDLTYEQVQENIKSLENDKAAMLHDLDYNTKLDWLKNYAYNYGYKDDEYSNQYLNYLNNRIEWAENPDNSEEIEKYLESLPNPDNKDIGIRFEEYLEKLKEQKTTFEAQRELNRRATFYENNYRQYESEKDYDKYAQKGASEDKGYKKQENSTSDDFAYLYYEDAEATNSEELEAYRFKDAFSPASTAGLVIYFHDNEKKTYNYLLGKYGEEKAKEYYESMERTLTARREEYANKAHSNFSKNANFGEKLVQGIGTTLLKPVGVVSNTIGNIKGLFDEESVDPYDDYHQIGNTVDKTREYEATHIENSIDSEILGKLASTAYQSANSIADMGVATRLGAVTGGGSAVSGTLFGLDSANSYLKSAYDRGLSKGQMYKGAVLTGIAEGIFEKFSLDKIIKMKPGNVKQLVLNTLKSAGIEASEEMATEFADIVIDNAVANANSENSLEKARLIKEEGLTEAEAEHKVFIDNCSRVFWSGAGGLLSGLAFGGVSNAVQYANNTATLNSDKAQEVGKSILLTDKQQEVLEKAKELGIDTSDAEFELNNLNETAQIVEQSPNENNQNAYNEAFERTSKRFAELELYIEQSGETATDADIDAEIENAQFNEAFQRELDGIDAAQTIEAELRARGTNNTERAVNYLVQSHEERTIADEVKKLTTVKDESGNVVRKGVEAKGVLPKDYTSEENSIESFYKSQGKNTVIFDSDSDVDGFTFRDTVYLNRNNAKKYVFKHEFSHTQENKQGFKDFGLHIESAIENSKRLSTWVDSKAKNIKGYDKNATLKEKIALVKKHYNEQRGGTLSNTGEDYEFYADFVMDNLYNGKDVETTVTELKRAFADDKTVWQRFCDFMRRLLKNIKNLGIYDGVKIAKLENEFSKVVRSENAQNKNTIKSSGINKIKFSAMNNNSFESNVDDIVNMTEQEALQNKREANFIKVMGKTPSVILENVKDSENIPVIIRFDALYLAARKSGVLEGHYHNLGKQIKKLPQYISNPDAIVRMNNGRINLFATIENEKGNNGIISIELNTVKDINSKYDRYNLVISVFTSKDNYVRNLIKNQGQKIEYKKENLLQVNPQLYEWLAIINNKFSNNNISQNDDIVNSSISENKKNDTNASFSIADKTDAEYLKAVQNGDIETAQKMVDEVAEEKGYTVKAYHGTLTKGITEFKKEFIGSRFSYDEVGFFFTDNLSIAEDYATSEFNADRKGEVISAYLKTSNAFVFDKNYALKNGYGNVFRDNDNINVWDIYQTALLEEAEEQNADSIIIKDGQSMMVVVFDPNQIKSADPVTYDDDGNVIPLSERFNEGKEDIRFSISDDVDNLKTLIEDLNNGEDISIDEISSNKAIADALEISNNTLETYNINTPERIELREKITNELLSLGSYTGVDENGKEVYNGKVNKDRRIDLVVGLPAAGKSSVLVNPLSEQFNARVIDSDMAKEALPEFNNGLGANAVHRESKDIVSDIIETAVINGDNIVHPIVGGSNVNKLIATIDGFKANGYSVYLHLNELPINKSMARMLNRFIETGRFIPPQIVYEYQNTPVENFETIIKTEGLIDGYSHYSNDVERGQKPILKKQKGVQLLSRLGRQSSKSITENRTKTQTETGLEESAFSVSDDFDNLVDKYGAIDKGMNAERDIAVPKKTSENKFTSYAARSIMEKGSVDTATLEKIKEQVINEALSHKRWSDKEALDYAQKQLKDGEAQNIWKDVVSGKTRVDKNKIAVAEGLLEMYANEGDADKVLTLTAELCEAGTRAGQTVQAFSLLKNMGGVGRLYYLQKVTNSLNRDLEKKFGKKAKRVKIGNSLATRMMNANGDEEVQKASEDIMKSLGKQVPSTFLDKWNAWRYLSMLGNLRTHIRNMVGNTIFMPVVAMKNGFATAIEHIAIRDVNNRTKAIKVSKEVKEFAEKDFEQMKEFVSSGGKYQDGSQIQEYQRVFKSKVLEGLRKFNFDMLEKEDIIFLKHHYKRAFGQFITARKLDVNNLTEKQLWEAREYATLEAQKATYRDASAVAEAINRLSHNNVISNVLIEGILPFKKTPINILKRGVEYSPIGLIKTLTKGSVDLRKGKITASQYIDGISSGLVGTGIMALGILLGSLGVAIGGMGDDEDKWFRKQNGEQEYSITLWGKSYTVDWAAPSCIPFFIGVELQKILSGENENWVTAFVNALDGALEPLTNLSMLQGINDTLETIKWSDSPSTSIVIDSITSYFTQALPTLAGQITRTFDGTRRKNYVDKTSAVPEWLQRVANTVSSKTGNWGKNPYRNAWGETEVDESFVGRIVSNFLSPGYYSKIDYDAVNAEIKELYNAKGNKLVLPDTVDTKINVNGKYKYLNADEYEKYQVETGQNAYKYIDEVIKSSFYKNADDDTKVDMIANVYSYCENIAKTTVSDYELSSADLKLKLYLERGVTMAEYMEAEYSEQEEESEDIKTNVAEVNELLDDIEGNYSDNEKMSMVDMAVKYIRDKQKGKLSKANEFATAASKGGYDIGNMFVANSAYESTDKKEDKINAIRKSDADENEKFLSMAYVYLDGRKVTYKGKEEYFSKLSASDKLKYISANENAIRAGIAEDY